METILVVALAVIFYLFIKSLMPVVGVRHKTVAELRKEARDTDKMFIDVRPTETYKQDPIRGFENIPLQELSANIHKLERSSEIVLISDRARQMKKASAKLKRRGFRYVTTVKGGTQEWKEGSKTK